MQNESPLVFQALRRRALLRESVLLRLLPQRSDLDETGWGELLAKSFLADLPNQHESMAHRIAIFLEDVKAPPVVMLPYRVPPGVPSTRPRA